jgi:hypothetical protein
MTQSLYSTIFGGAAWKAAIAWELIADHAMIEQIAL